jgi:phage tail tube protein FII
MPTATFLMFLSLLNQRRENKWKKNRNFNTIYEMNVSYSKKHVNEDKVADIMDVTICKDNIDAKECIRTLLDSGKNDL